MVFKSIIGAVCACLAVVSINVSAVVLEERLGGLAYYDPDADLTWLANANVAGTANWWDAIAWGVDFTVGGVDRWRIPTTVHDWAGINIVGSELGNLFYNVLGGVAGTPISAIHNANYDLFNNIQDDIYWTSQAGGLDYGEAVSVSMFNGIQYHDDMERLRFTWAVYTGDVEAVPVPAAVWLFASGLIGLVGFARRKAHT